MERSGQEIQEALRAFVAKWRSYAGSERAEAQTFCNELFACYGSDRQQVGALFEDFKSSAGFMELHWPGICIIGMKKPAKDLTAAREQVKHYWKESSDPEHDIPAARWVVVCSFGRFEIWEPGRFPGKARVAIDLADLPDHYDVLNFLVGPKVEPVFAEHHRQMTTQAAEKVALAYQALIARSAAPSGDIQRLVLQSVWCMFAEDLGMLTGWPYQGTVQSLIQDPDRSSASELGFLFRLLNQKTNHNRKRLPAGTTYVNGELFAEPAYVDLDQYELDLMLKATEFDWRKVDPTIFGSLMEGVLGDRRWELGAHYTHEADIMKIVTPTIVRPWQERIDAVETPSAGRDLLDQLCAFKVLDPACGCGNFLYVAYRELRALEQQLKEKVRDIAKAKGLPVPPGPWPYVALTNMQGIDLEPAAVMISRVTLWMGHRQMIDVYGEAEDPLPLVTLSSLRVGDALRVEWPETDCIIGNPPFLGSQLIHPRRDGRGLCDVAEARVQRGCQGLLRLLVSQNRRPPEARTARGARRHQLRLAEPCTVGLAVRRRRWRCDHRRDRQPEMAGRGQGARLARQLDRRARSVGQAVPDRWRRGRRHRTRPARHLAGCVDAARAPGQQGALLPGADPGGSRVHRLRGRGAGEAGLDRGAAGGVRERACRRLLARRSELCLQHDVVFTELYNAMDEGAYTDLRALRRDVDESIAGCYGWPRQIAQDDKALVARLAELNRQIIEGEREYHPFDYLERPQGG